MGKGGLNFMKAFFDTEFTGLKKDTTLVSIGVVLENGTTYYAELTDWDKSWIKKDIWFKKNVYDNLLFMDGANHTWDRVADYQVYGDKKAVADSLRSFLRRGKTIEFVSDVCHYDMMLLADLYDGAMNLPKNFCPCCYDINQDILHFLNNNRDPKKNRGITMQEAFDYSRESLLKMLHADKIPGKKHNALYDAQVIKRIYEMINP